MHISVPKNFFKVFFLTFTFVTFFLLILFPLVQNNSVSSEIFPVIIKENLPGLPVSLMIPAINIKSKVLLVGVTPNGAMEVPNNAADVGWFKLGVRPGELGSAVISGHFDDKDGKMGVFGNLYKLKIGDKIFVTDDKQKVVTFVVRNMRTYNPGYADEVFSTNDGVAHLNLVTCDGVWDGVKKSYTKRLVVFADIFLN